MLISMCCVDVTHEPIPLPWHPSLAKWSRWQLTCSLVRLSGTLRQFTSAAQQEASNTQLRVWCSLGTSSRLRGTALRMYLARLSVGVLHTAAHHMLPVAQGWTWQWKMPGRQYSCTYACHYDGANRYNLFVTYQRARAGTQPGLLASRQSSGCTCSGKHRFEVHNMSASNV